MRIAIFINTPAHAHLYRNIIANLKKKQHDVKILARNYGETLSVLEGCNIPYIIYSRPSNSKFIKSLSFPIDIFRAYRILKKFSPDIMVGHGIPSVYTAYLLRKPSIIFNDNDFAPIQFILLTPFVKSIVTPSGFTRNLGKRHVKVTSFKELSYLHPKYFTPNKDIYEILGIARDEKFILMRFNALDAVHDVGIKTFSLEEKKYLIEEIGKKTTVFISSEGKIPAMFRKYNLPSPKHRIHDVLYYADLVITETGTITTEAAILGTPTVVCNSKLNRCGNFVELNKYGLIFSYENAGQAVEKAIELANAKDLKKIWKVKREALLKDHIDFASFMSWFIEKYPYSHEKIKETPECQYMFRDGV